MDLKACQFDIGTAFLECELDEDIYMRLPDYLGGKIWKLNRAIYGLKQSGHLFVKLLNHFLRELGFKQSQTEPQLFTLITKFDQVDAAAGIKSDSVHLMLCLLSHPASRGHAIINYLKIIS